MSKDLFDLNLCACLGPPPGEQYCYCQREKLGMDTSYYEWTEEEKQSLHKALTEAFGWKETKQ